MFTVDNVIDSVQNGKKEAVKFLVKNEVIADAMNKFVDAQSAYTKSAVNTSIGAFSTIVGETTRLAQEASKFDYTKFGETFTKAFANAKK